jgi:tRNA(fMet)-specific endonuclease VapC
VSRLNLILSQIGILPFGTPAVDAYAAIVECIGFSRGRDFDRMIAGHAISVGATLVTDNLDDFADIPGLTLENWMTP